MRKALVVGIDYYSNVQSLFGCVNDAYEVKNVLERHGDGSVNFGVKLRVATAASSQLTRKDLKESVRELFAGDSDIALFYFAGHGHIEATGGYLVASEATSGDDGLQLNDVLALANASSAKNKVIILDSCHSGIAGTPDVSVNRADLSEGLTILTASGADQYASEENGRGVFTRLLVDALRGGAANLVGDITPGSVYAHIDQSLGPWEQRPVFKTNVKTFTSLREVTAPIPLADLRRLAEFFPVPGFEYPLDPSFEPEHPDADPANTPKLAVLQKYVRVNLVVPVGVDHMYFAAVESKSCKLTVLGEHYRDLVARNRI